MAVWRLQVNTGGTNAANYCLKNHVAAMGWSLRELTQAERSGIHTFLDYCKLARTQYKSFDSVCRMVEDVKEGDLLWMRSRNEGKYYIARVKANSTRNGFFICLICSWIPVYIGQLIRCVHLYCIFAEHPGTVRLNSRNIVFPFIS